jgi:hypothetical protein
MKHFYTNRGRCEVLTRYLSMQRRPGGDWAKAMNYDMILHCAQWAFVHYLVMPDDGCVEEAEARIGLSRDVRTTVKQNCDWVTGVAWMFLILCEHHKGKSHIKDHTFNLLKPSGFFTYHQLQHSKILHGSRFALSVLYGSQNYSYICFIHH